MGIIVQGNEYAWTGIQKSGDKFGVFHPSLRFPQAPVPKFSLTARNTLSNEYLIPSTRKAYQIPSPRGTSFTFLVSQPPHLLKKKKPQLKLRLKKKSTCMLEAHASGFVAPTGVDPVTSRFSVVRSTN